MKVTYPVPKNWHKRKWYIKHWKIDPEKYSKPVLNYMDELVYEETDVEQGMLYEYKESL